MIALLGVSCDKENVENKAKEPQSAAEKMELAIAAYKDYNVEEVVELLCGKTWAVRLYGSLDKSSGVESVGPASDCVGKEFYSYQFYADGTADIPGEHGTAGPESAFVCQAGRWEFDATTRQLTLHFQCRFLVSGETFEFESVYGLIGLSDVCLILEVDSSDRRSRYLYEPFNG